MEVPNERARRGISALVRRRLGCAISGHRSRTTGCHPDGPSTELHLTVEPSEEDDAADDDQYVWRYGTTEEEAGFGEAKYERGVAATLDEGQRQCWAAAIEFLGREGYTEGEIANGV